MREIRPLTTLRAAAAFLVFMYHYAVLFPPSLRGVAATEHVPGRAIWNQGQAGVSIFFVLSGFLITRLYYDRLGSPGTLAGYFVKRFARIWPLFVVLAIVQHAAAFMGGAPPSRAWWVTFTLTQGFFRDLRLSGLPTAWTLTIEESFYAIAPLLFALIAWMAAGRRGAPRAATPVALPRVVFTLAILVVAFGAAGVAAGRWFAAHRAFGGFLDSVDFVLHCTLAGRIAEFAIGMVAAFLHRSRWPERALRGARATAVAIVCLLAIPATLAWKDAHATGWRYTAATELVAVLAGALVLALTREEGLVARALSARLPVHLGRTSYAFYLVQASVVLTPLLALTDRLGWWRLPALFVATQLVCAALYAWIEAPARRAIVARFAASRGLEAEARSAG